VLVGADIAQRGQHLDRGAYIAVACAHGQAMFAVAEALEGAVCLDRAARRRADAISG
jgi:hypothetical protein